MHVQGQEIKPGQRLTYHSVSGPVACRVVHVWTKQVLLSVTSRTRGRWGYGYGHEFKVIEGNPWLELR